MHRCDPRWTVPEWPFRRKFQRRPLDPDAHAPSRYSRRAGQYRGLNAAAHRLNSRRAVIASPLVQPSQGNTYDGKVTDAAPTDKPEESDAASDDGGLLSGARRPLTIGLVLV